VVIVDAADAHHLIDHGWHTMCPKPIQRRAEAICTVLSFRPQKLLITLMAMVLIAVVIICAKQRSSKIQEIAERHGHLHQNGLAYRGAMRNQSIE
jgi:hypothetical protein